MSFEVPKYRLLALLKAEKKLGLLEDYGVDDWDWYEDAINDTFNDGKDAVNNLSYNELLREFKEIEKITVLIGHKYK